MEKTYICIDLKSFYASVECKERGLNPLQTNLVVADSSRTEKTICLAVSPSLKAYGISGRPRLFEVVSKVKEINQERKKRNHYVQRGESHNESELAKNQALALSFIIATPQMAKYIQYSTQIYNIYLKYISEEDIHVYSIDEVFMDVSSYLNNYNSTPYELANKMIHDVLDETGITATAGIGSNLYLAKVAMDIVAKHIDADKDGVRIAILDEMGYRQSLWNHRPLTDFWRIGKGTERKLNELGLYTMGDIACCSRGEFNEYHNEDLLYQTFGINAELLIDHAFGVESCTMEAIKAYQSRSKSISVGQVLSEGYSFEKTKIILKEMIDSLALDLVDKTLVTNSIMLDIGYDALTDSLLIEKYQDKMCEDRYGRMVPKGSHGSITIANYTSSTKELMEQVITLFENISDSRLKVKRVGLALSVIPRNQMPKNVIVFDLFSTPKNEDSNEEEKEKKAQEVILSIKKKFGKNAVMKGTSLFDGATGKERNKQIGGHKA